MKKLIFLLFFLFSSVIFGYELEDKAYSLKELMNILKKPLSQSSPLYKSGKYLGEGGRSAFLKKYHRNYDFQVGDYYFGEHEVRFENGKNGVRYFRNKNKYILMTENISWRKGTDPNWLDGLISEGDMTLIEDRLEDEVGGYILFRDEEAVQRSYTLCFYYPVENGYVYCGASFSASILNKQELERLKKLKTKQNWKKYIRMEPVGKYLPGSGPGEGVRPGTGTLLKPYD